MTHVYFHRANNEIIVLDQNGVDVEDMVEAHQRALQAIQDLAKSPTKEDWREWTLHVADEEGEEIFLMPFSCALGRMH